MSSYDNMVQPAGLRCWGNGAAYLYVLRDPDTKEIRYVGVTKDSSGPATRYSGHIFEGGAAKMAWIRGLQAEGKLPVMTVICVLADADSKNVEARYIRRLQATGHRLVNTHKMLAWAAYKP